MRLQLSLLLLMATCGCGGTSGLTLHPVNGIVTRSGKPLAGVNVTLLPKEIETTAPALAAVTDEAGRFSVMTGTGSEGAPEGEYRVLLSTMPTVDYAKSERHSTVMIPRVYADSKTTPLVCFVSAADDNRLEIDVSTTGHSGRSQRNRG